MSRSSLPDRCECSYEEGLPAAVPCLVTYTGSDSLRADYRCTRCGRQWWTGWRATSCGWPALAPVTGQSSHIPTLAEVP